MPAAKGILFQVWPGPTVFPDFTNLNATLWWTAMAGAFHDIIPFDGVLIVSSFDNILRCLIS